MVLKSSTSTSLSMFNIVFSIKRVWIDSWENIDIENNRVIKSAFFIKMWKLQKPNHLLYYYIGKKAVNINIEITSPIIGTFYRKPSPDKPVFVEVGDNVSPNTVVCMIEAMKLFNEIESEVSGKIVKVLVEDGTPVEVGQPLYLVDPA